jgi:hypothetical protein
VLHFEADAAERDLHGVRVYALPSAQAPQWKVRKYGRSALTATSPPARPSGRRSIAALRSPD